MPMVLVVSGLVCANTYLAMPKDPGNEDTVLQIWLQARTFAHLALFCRTMSRPSAWCLDLHTTSRDICADVCAFRLENAPNGKGIVDISCRSPRPVNGGRSLRH